MMTFGILGFLPAEASRGEKGEVELGIYAGYAMPDDYASQAGARNPADDLLVGARIGGFVSSRWGVEFSTQRFSSETRFAPSAAMTDVDFDIDSIRFNLLHNFRPGQRFRPFVTVGIGRDNVSAPTDIETDSVSFNAGGGLRWYLSERFGIRLDGRYMTHEVRETPIASQGNVEGTLGVLWSFGGQGPTDSDGDGVRDRRDDCPATPRGAVVDAAGCPIDSDGDGVADGIDRCPATAAGVRVDATGCLLDTDGDGVHDGADQCAKTPKGARVDNRGCPTDRDRDGVADGIDKCPDTPDNARVDATGCPKDSDGDRVWDGLDRCPDSRRGAKVDEHGCAMDSDNDGVPDGVDRCPGTPPGTQVDAKGCKKLFDEGRKSLVLEGVRFEFNSDELTAAAKAILDRVALSLNEWSEIRVEIAGHTDSKGSESYNLRLSQRRSESVRSYLQGKGVDASRMTAVGFGETRLRVDPEKGEADRRANRRVELRKLN